MTYEERLDLLMESIKSSKLNGEEFTMIYGILTLSKERNEFNIQYNDRVAKIIKQRGD